MPRKFEVGDRVVITAHNHYKENILNAVGTIESTFRLSERHTQYGIKLDNYSNSKSSKGLYWFETYSFKLENEYEREEIPMFKNYTTVEVAFPGNPTTYSHACYDPEIKEGDLVVVNTGHHGFALANVVSIPDEEQKREVQFGREVICRVDTSKFNARVEARKRASELKREMEKRMREAQEIALYEMLAEKDPTLKGMLDEYKAILESSK